MRWPAAPRQRSQSVIVQGPDLDTVKRLVLEVGGTVTHELTIIRAVGAQMTAAQQDRLTALASDLKIYVDGTVETSGRGNDKTGDTVLLDDDNGTDPYTGNEWLWEPTVQTTPAAMLQADVLHQEGITGLGVTVAVLDTGLHDFAPVMYRDGQPRVLGHYNATRNKVWNNPLRHSDGNGHGGHVNGLIVNRDVHGPTGTFYGLAPGADLVVVKAFDDQGQGTYSDVIAGIDWIVNNKDAYGIGVLNLSFSAPPRSHYWDDPLNQAVMAAWQAGIVVVASAGNLGPDPMTIGVPGNVPYVITVGAMTDNYTPDDASDDLLASFSSAGPTFEAFVKPEIVAPGGHVVSSMGWWTTIAEEHHEFHNGGDYFVMSGTSQAAAIVSGIAALAARGRPVV